MNYQQRQSSRTLARSSSTMVTPRSRCSSWASTSSSFPVLLSVFVCSVTLLLIASCLGVADGGKLTGHGLVKGSFEDKCLGTWNASLFARLHRICDDCYNMFHEPQVYTFCMDDCFTSTLFRDCVTSLAMEDRLPEIKEWIRLLHGAPPFI